MRKTNERMEKTTISPICRSVWGSLEYYDKRYDRISTKSEKKLALVNRLIHRVTTTKDPVIRQVRSLPPFRFESSRRSFRLDLQNPWNCLRHRCDPFDLDVLHEVRLSVGHYCRCKSFVFLFRTIYLCRRNSVRISSSTNARIRRSVS